jgi:hypothetical protein
MPTVRVLWGKYDKQEQEYAFATQAEADAFLLGVAEMEGWEAYEVLEGEDETEETS